MAFIFGFISLLMLGVAVFIVSTQAFRPGGESITARIMKISEGQATGDDVSLVAAGIAFVVGLLLFSTSVLIFSIPYSRKKKRLRLLKEGVRVSGRVTEVKQARNVSVNRRHPYVIECSWRSPLGIIYIFCSQYLWANPSSLLEDNNVTVLPVYYNSDNMKDYYVDVTTLDKYTKGKIVHL